MVMVGNGQDCGGKTQKGEKQNRLDTRFIFVSAEHLEAPVERAG
jgi:hypothetical protein